MVNPLVAYSDDENSSDSASSQLEENPVVDTVLNQGEESQLPTKPSISSPKSDPSTSPPPKVTSPSSPVKETSPPPVAESPPPPVIESPSPPVQETPLPPNPETPITTVQKNPSSSPSHKTTPQNPPPSPHSPINDDILLSTLHPKKPRRPRKHIEVKQVCPHRPVTRSANVVKPTDDATSSV
ncbi:proline-rich receptor-like protein kinase PERK9 [Solanum pennellii]|uniref:Proline-rich receptor-like protein kinase PERK9 n=1 Tax=Solanum pennellii TaxID=28526 RepID=A0ABM1UW94_SOLPN|nr:proline-rich receptor-like protein kinase PERK9 [Solanum pennellii]